jgi:hypothetical protein
VYLKGVFVDTGVSPVYVDDYSLLNIAVEASIVCMKEWACWYSMCIRTQAS